MARKKTLEKKIDALTEIVNKGFAAVATDISDVRKEMATKDDPTAVENRLGHRIDGLQVKINAIQKTVDTETMLRTDLQLPRRVRTDTDRGNRPTGDTAGGVKVACLQAYSRCWRAMPITSSRCATRRSCAPTSTVRSRKTA
jgi:hypothetical protein